MFQLAPSASLVAFITGDEGFRPTAYLDPPGNTKGKYSIGEGHQIQPNEQYLMKAVLTRADSNALKQKDLSYVAKSLNRLYTRMPNQGVYDGIFDVGFNAGTGAAAKVIKVWNATGDTAKTAAHAMLYVKANGRVNTNLVARRAHDAILITGGTGASIISAITDPKKKEPGLS
jgi:GH24 family phage-related lysozyme (muramidase)